VQKCATGIGILATSLIVQSLGIEQGTPQDQVPEAVVTRLALIYMAVGVFLGLCAAFWLDRFPISRADHEARVAARAARGDLHPDNPLDEAIRADPDAHGITP
jgi:glycoside/pentoside/hexuronide:cation symporter, GPH family